MEKYEKEIYELMGKEFETEDRLFDAWKQLRVARLLAQIYGTTQKVQDEMEQQEEVVRTIKADLAEIRRERDELRKRGRAEEREEEDMLRTRETQEKPPSPRTRSPTIFVNLLPAFGEMGKTQEEMKEIVAALTMPQTQTPKGALSADDEGQDRHQRWRDPPRIWFCCRWALMPAGTIIHPTEDGGDGCLREMTKDAFIAFSIWGSGGH